MTAVRSATFIPAGQEIDSLFNTWPAGMLLLSREAAPPTLRAYRQALTLTGIIAFARSRHANPSRIPAIADADRYRGSTSQEKTGTMRILLFVAAMALPVAAFAQGQSGPVPLTSGDSNVLFDAPGMLPKKPRAGLPDVKANPLAWPRLDPGAIICRSPDDLARLAARHRGEAVNGPIDCQITRVVTPISIVQRKSPGMTEIRTNDSASGGTGWTDAWLPEKAPVTARH